jgi:hypothetical protein
MTLEQFNEAIQIISVQHSSTVKINSPRTSGFVGDLGKTYFRLHIINSTPAVIHDLVAAGFSLSMTEDGLLVAKI